VDHSAGPPVFELWLPGEPDPVLFAYNDSMFTMGCSPCIASIRVTAPPSLWLFIRLQSLTVTPPGPLLESAEHLVYPLAPQAESDSRARSSLGLHWLVWGTLAAFWRRSWWHFGTLGGVLPVLLVGLLGSLAAHPVAFWRHLGGILSGTLAALLAGILAVLWQRLRRRIPVALWQSSGGAFGGTLAAESSISSSASSTPSPRLVVLRVL